MLEIPILKETFLEGIGRAFGNVSIPGPEQVMGLFQPFRSRQVLRTQRFTLSAFGTSVSALFFFKPYRAMISVARRFRVVIHNGFVIKLENPRDADPLGTGHAVLTFGAVNGR